MLGKQIQPFALAQPQLENEILGRYLVLWLLESCRGCGKRLPLGLTHSLVFLQQVLKGQYNNQKTPVASVSSLELQPEPSKHHPWSCDKEETPPDLHAPPLLSSPLLILAVPCSQESFAGKVVPVLGLCIPPWPRWLCTWDSGSNSAPSASGVPGEGEI